MKLAEGMDMVAKNSSLANLPIDIVNPVSLKRYLARIAEAIDVIIGVKGDNAALTTDDDSLASLATALGGINTTLVSLQDQINSLSSAVEDNTTAIVDLDERVTTLEAFHP